MSAFRSVEEFSKQGFLESMAGVLRLMRLRELLKRWVAASQGARSGNPDALGPSPGEKSALECGPFLSVGRNDIVCESCGPTFVAERWVASAWLLTEKHFRRIDGHADLWALAAILGREDKSKTQWSKERVAQDESAAAANLQLRPAYPLF